MLDLYQEIPPELYRAVAEILAFVYAINKKAMP
jgi:flagellar biosynthesis protein